MSATSRLLRLLGVEGRKALGGRSLVVGLVAVAAVATLTALSHTPSGPEETAWSRTAASLAAGLWAAEIFLLVAGTTAISGETAGGTLKMILPHAYRRSDWIVAKALVLAGSALALLLVALAVALAAGALSGGLGAVTQSLDLDGMGPATTETLHGAGVMGGHLGASAGVALATLVATAWLGLLVSCVFDGVVASVSTGFLLFLGFKSAGALFGAGPDVLSWIYAWYPGEMLTRVEKLGRALAERWNEDLSPRALRLSAGVAFASLATSIVLFSRRDLHA